MVKSIAFVAFLYFRNMEFANFFSIEMMVLIYRQEFSWLWQHMIQVAVAMELFLAK